jgi:hypothetical protein
MQASSAKYSCILVMLGNFFQWLAVASADHPNSALVGLMFAYLLP